MESNPHAGTGSYSCDKCGRRFAYAGHRSDVAKKARDEHKCDGHPHAVIGALMSMCLEREERIDGEWGDGNTDRAKLREELEEELDTRLREQRMANAARQQRLRQLHQIDGFEVAQRGPVVICAESYYDFDPPPGPGDRVMIDGKEAIIKGIEAFMTNPPNYGEHLSILVVWL